MGIAAAALDFTRPIASMTKPGEISVGLYAAEQLLAGGKLAGSIDEAIELARTLDSASGPVALIGHEGGVGLHAVDGAVTLDVAPGARFPVSLDGVDSEWLAFNQFWGLEGRTGGAAGIGLSTDLPRSPVEAIVHGESVFRPAPIDNFLGGAI